MRRVLLLALVLTGCGASEQQHVQAALREYDRAWARKDYPGVCARMTDAGRREWAKITAQPDCVSGIRALAALSADPPPTDGFELVLTLKGEPLATERIRIEGDTATGYTRLGPANRLKKVDGRWLVDASPG